MQNQEQELFLSLLPKLGELIKKIAWKARFPRNEYEDLYQDVIERLWRKRAQVIQNGAIHFGYAEKCIWSVIADRKKVYLKHTNFLKSQSYLTGNPAEKRARQQSSLPDSNEHYISHGGERVELDVLDGNMDVLPDNQTPLDEYEEFQLLSKVEAYYASMKKGLLKKKILELCLSGITAGGAAQGKDIAEQLSIERKSVSQALSEVRKEVKDILDWQTKPKKTLKA